MSGIVFTKGNEHKILQLVEDETITLVLPETTLMVTTEVLKEKFPGFEKLLDNFLKKVGFESVRLTYLWSRLEGDAGKARDEKDTPIYAAVALAKPDYVVTGDATLRVDLSASSEITLNTKVCSSREFLRRFRA